MNRKRSLILGGIGITVLIMVSMFLKWPSNIAAWHHYQAVKSKEVIVHTSKAVANPKLQFLLQPQIIKLNPKWIPFPKKASLSSSINCQIDFRHRVHVMIP